MTVRAADRILRLREQIDRANHAYYVLDAPTVGDGEYDRGMAELRTLEERDDGLRTPDSPTQNVGGASTLAALDEVGVLLRDDGAPDARALEPGRLDPLPCDLHHSRGGVGHDNGADQVG